MLSSLDQTIEQLNSFSTAYSHAKHQDIANLYGYGGAIGMQDSSLIGQAEDNLAVTSEKRKPNRVRVVSQE